MKKSLLFSIIALVIAILAGIVLYCRTPDSLPLGNTDWRPVRIDGTAVTGGKPVLVIAPDGQVRGNGGVNGFFGKAEIDPGKNEIRFGALGATLMAGPEEAMEAERRLFQALDAARAYRIAGDELTLLDDDGGPVAVFTGVPAADGAKK